MSKKLTWRYSADGILEGIDPDTGLVVETEKKKPQPKLKRKKSLRPRGRPPVVDHNPLHTVIDGDGRKVIVQKGVNPDQLPRTMFPYSEVTCELICQKITEGKTIQDIGLMEGFPPAHVIHKWARKYPEFKTELKLAKEGRAEYYADQVMAIGSKNIDPREANVERLKADIFKWGAEIGNPQEYGKQTKITGDKDAPLTFIIDTGVRRAGDEPKPEEIEVDHEES